MSEIAIREIIKLWALMPDLNVGVAIIIIQDAKKTIPTKVNNK